MTLGRETRVVAIDFGGKSGRKVDWKSDFEWKANMVNYSNN